MKSVRVLDSGDVVSASQDGTIAISALQSNEVVARVDLGLPAWFSAVLPDGSIAVPVMHDHVTETGDSPEKSCFAQGFSVKVGLGRKNLERNKNFTRASRDGQPALGLW